MRGDQRKNEGFCPYNADALLVESEGGRVRILLFVDGGCLVGRGIDHGQVVIRGWGGLLSGRHVRDGGVERAACTEVIQYQLSMRALDLQKFVIAGSLRVDCGRVCKARYGPRLRHQLWAGAREFCFLPPLWATAGHGHGHYYHHSLVQPPYPLPLPLTTYGVTALSNCHGHCSGNFVFGAQTVSNSLSPTCSARAPSFGSDKEGTRIRASEHERGRKKKV